jgi:cell division septation protein DedD
MEHLPEIKPLMKPMPKALEGYIIQLAFKDRSEARSWADTFEQRGYAVSMTEASAGESLRVRVGNFRLRDEAERQLKSIRDNGLIGIILNLPQAYRPEVRSSLP